MANYKVTKVSEQLVINLIKLKQNNKEIYDKDKAIYRIFKLDSFLKDFINKTLTLVDYKKWDDPYENFIHKYCKNGHLDNNRWRSYGQCWSENEESDAMWRIYSNDKKGIKVKMIPNKFIEMYEDHMFQFDSKPSMDYCCFIEPVRYLDDDKIINYVRRYKFSIKNNAFTKHQVDNGLMRYYKFLFPLLTKRMPFAHESEVRLMYCTGRNDADEFNEKILGNNKIVQFKIDPNILFKEIILDPRLSNNDANKLTKILKSNGYKNKIEKSTLYDSPEFD